MATERRRRSIVRSHPSGSISSIGARSPPAPALLKTTSIPPVFSAAKSISALISSGLETSVRLKWILPFDVAARSVPPFSSISAAMTVAPSAAKSRQLALPMPDAAPVMTTVFPANLMWLSISFPTHPVEWIGLGQRASICRYGKRSSPLDACGKKQRRHRKSQEKLRRSR